MQLWSAGPTRLGKIVEEQSRICLNVYAEDSSRVQQDANNERRIAHGGYSSRQFEELIQNATDAAANGGGRVEVHLSEHTLYVANDGEPFTADGVRAVLAADISAKGDEQIGKFGIGFKSVLAVSDSPRVYSRSVSFGFDRTWAEGVLRGQGFESEHYPVMRLAKVLDPVADGSTSDPVLAELMTWASTVIVAPLIGGSQVLAARLAQFPPEFILFATHLKIVRLRSVLIDALGQSAALSGDRTIERVDHGDGLVTVKAGPQEQKWSIARRQVVVSPAALAEAGHGVARSSIELQYAVQLPPSKSDGALWAYFPTEYKTTLSGIVNAPWKLSDDRRHLLEGRFNNEILAALPELVAQALSQFADTDHAMALLDALPSRGGELGQKEARNWVDAAINGPIFEHMRGTACLLAADGSLRKPSELRWLGELGVPTWLERWSEVSGAPLGEWLDASAYSQEERRLKVSRLKGAKADIDASAASLGDWLEALVRDKTVEAAADAIRLAASLLRDEEGPTWLARRARAKDRDTYEREVSQQIHAARVLRLEDGIFSAPKRGRVFVRVPGEDRNDVAFVDSDLTAQPGVKEALAELGVVLMDRRGELRKLLHNWNTSTRGPGDTRVWSEIWKVLRQIPFEAALGLLREDLNGEFEEAVRVRTAAGVWVPVSEAFLAGRLVPSDGSRDREFLIDPREHANDEELLKEFGAVEVPTIRSAVRKEPWFLEWEERARDFFVAETRYVDRTKAEIMHPIVVTWPLQPVTQMSDEAKHVVTQLIVNRGLPGPVNVRARREGIKVVGPETYFLQRNARLATGHGLLPPEQTVLNSAHLRPGVFPTAEVSAETAKRLGVRPDIESLSAPAWRQMKARVDSWKTADRDLDRYHFYAWSLYLAPENLLVESPLVVAVGHMRQPVEAVNVGVTGSDLTYESLIDAGIPAMLIEEEGDLARFVDELNTPRGEDLLQEEVVVEPSGEAVPLTDEFPPLRLRLESGDQDLLLQSASRLERMTATPRGQVAKRLPARRDGNTVFVTAETAAGRLTQVSDVLGLGLDVDGVQKILTSMETAATDKLRTQLKRCADDDTRLVMAVGLEALRRTVPAQALGMLDHDTGGATPEQVAGLARAVHGVGVLKVLRHALEEKGLQPPHEWAGRRLTRQWVDSLGFPAEWAGFPESQRAAVEVIDGPAVLNPLHDYQEFVTERIEAMLRGTGRDRGMVSLPTGAGKTRVTVEALVKAISLGIVDNNRPLVWIAQTDELCEQAAETWTYVWRAIGPQVAMRLGRLWGSNDVTEEPGSFQLVIATVAKLNSIMKMEGKHGWLKEPSVVVIDEAHASIAPTYTRVLEWMGRSSRKRDASVRRPLIGLTATPFRGTSEEENKRLVNRYGENRLDRGAFMREDPYEELQSMGVLAQVRHEVLDGVDVTLSDQDKEDIANTRKMPSAVTEKLGADVARTRRVVDHIASLPDDWTIIAFAPSVENARVLAALLANRGIPAVSVSGDTDSAARRHYIEEFKAGRIRVITNYNVLTQGFDAPKVRAVYVARPTFSPNVYQQMVGRGLRGPLNGGSEEVLIVNVKDNFDQYGDMLAFNEFEYLWTRQ